MLIYSKLHSKSCDYLDKVAFISCLSQNLWSDCQQSFRSIYELPTVIVSTSDRPNVSLIHVWKSIKERSPFCEKENSALSERTCLTNHTIGWDKSKIITTSRLYHQPGILTPPTLLNSWWWRLTTWRLFTLRQKKGQLISKRIKGALAAAIRSPLMKALDRSVETLGLWIVTPRLRSLNL